MVTMFLLEHQMCADLFNHLFSFQDRSLFSFLYYRISIRDFTPLHIYFIGSPIIEYLCTSILVTKARQQHGKLYTFLVMISYCVFQTLTRFSYNADSTDVNYSQHASDLKLRNYPNIFAETYSGIYRAWQKYVPHFKLSST